MVWNWTINEKEGGHDSSSEKRDLKEIGVREAREIKGRNEQDGSTKWGKIPGGIWLRRMASKEYVPLKKSWVVRKISRYKEWQEEKKIEGKDDKGPNYFKRPLSTYPVPPKEGGRSWGGARGKTVCKVASAGFVRGCSSEAR